MYTYLVFLMHITKAKRGGGGLFYAYMLKVENIVILNVLLHLLF